MPHSALRQASNKQLIRWSLSSLAKQGEGGLTPTLSKSLLSETTVRLAHQYYACERLKDTVEAHARNKGAMRKILKELDTLLYIHLDTFKFGHQIVSNQKIWERFSKADQHLFFTTAEQLRSRHARTVETTVDFLTDLRSIETSDVRLKQIEEEIDLFLRGRIGLQLLCDHFVKLHKKSPTGAIATDCPLRDILIDASTEASSLCDAHLQIVPETLLPPLDGINVTTVRPWLHHALVEILKNAMAATVNQAASDKKELPDPIDVKVNTTAADLIVDIVDRGTGCVDVDRAFALGHSSVGKRWDRLNEQQSYASVRSPLSSLGVGLHSSRCMMEHFGCAVQLTNNPSGMGCTGRLVLSLDYEKLERTLRL